MLFFLSRRHDYGGVQVRIRAEHGDRAEDAAGDGECEGEDARRDQLYILWGALHPKVSLGKTSKKFGGFIECQTSVALLRIQVFFFI